MRNSPAGPIVVFDVGGTNLRAGLYDIRTGHVERLVREETPGIRKLPDAAAEVIREQLYRRMAAMAQAITDGVFPRAVSVAFPGPVAPDGAVVAAPTVWGDSPGSTLVPVGEHLRRLWPDSRVFVVNDMTAVGYTFLTETRQDLCVMTISSGIGHKVFLRGEPVLGPHGRGGELGHLRVDFAADAPLCDCGGRGHLGALASGGAAVGLVERLAAEDPAGFSASSLRESSGPDLAGLDNEAIVAAFRAEDPWTRRVIQRMAQRIGQILAAVHLAVGIEHFVIVGGFALALGEPFREMLAASAASCGWGIGTDWDAMIVLGRSDRESGLIGAGLYAVRLLDQLPS